MKNKYKVKVYEEYVLTYTVEAKNSDEAIEIAEALAENDDKMEFCGREIKSEKI
jgi:hypothetical protein